MAAREVCPCERARVKASEDGCERVSPRASEWASLILSVLRCKAMEYLKEGGGA